MKPYWNEMMTPRSGMPIREVEMHHDNVYIKDALGRVWQIWMDVDTPLVQLLGREDD